MRWLEGKGAGVEPLFYPLVSPQVVNTRALEEPAMLLFIEVTHWVLLGRDQTVSGG